MGRLSLELSDGLNELAGLFDDYEHEPRILDPEDARAFRRCITILRQKARDLENEVSRHRWNQAALRDREEMETRSAALVVEASRPGSNLRLVHFGERPFGERAPQ